MDTASAHLRVRIIQVRQRLEGVYREQNFGDVRVDCVLTKAHARRFKQSRVVQHLQVAMVTHVGVRVACRKHVVRLVYAAAQPRLHSYLWLRLWVEQGCSASRSCWSGVLIPSLSRSPSLPPSLSLLPVLPVVF
eukprot:scaffold51787_cov30-Tisochrysis_lutea.AAC.10